MSTHIPVYMYKITYILTSSFGSFYADRQTHRRADVQTNASKNNTRLASMAGVQMLVCASISIAQNDLSSDALTAVQINITLICSRHDHVSGYTDASPPKDLR